MLLNLDVNDDTTSQGEVGGWGEGVDDDGEQVIFRIEVKNGRKVKVPYRPAKAGGRPSRPLVKLGGARSDTRECFRCGHTGHIRQDCKATKHKDPNMKLKDRRTPL